MDLSEIYKRFNPRGLRKLLSFNQNEFKNIFESFLKYQCSYKKVNALKSIKLQKAIYGNIVERNSHNTRVLCVVDV